MNDRKILKRSIPEPFLTQDRYNIYCKYKEFDPIKPKTNGIEGLSQGNKKTGISGEVYKSMYVWNLPPFVTCPGASEWCRCHCYNLDIREDVYQINVWRENLWLYINKKNELKERIMDQLLNNTKGKCGVRIHSSGDFFSEEYIVFWTEIVKCCPEVNFWAYTRSWRIDTLKNALDNLQEFPNINIIASIDSSMTEPPPEKYTHSLVFEDKAEMVEHSENYKGMICPEQYKGHGGCVDCGICANKSIKSVLFLLH